MPMSQLAMPMSQLAVVPIWFGWTKCPQAVPTKRKLCKLIRAVPINFKTFPIQAKNMPIAEFCGDVWHLKFIFEEYSEFLIALIVQNFRDIILCQFSQMPPLPDAALARCHPCQIPPCQLPSLPDATLARCHPWQMPALADATLARCHPCQMPSLPDARSKEQVPIPWDAMLPSCHPNQLTVLPDANLAKPVPNDPKLLQSRAKSANTVSKLCSMIQSRTKIVSNEPKGCRSCAKKPKLSQMS